jgi:glycine cleavage system aminomethyltransferase T/glycine/D-amino acid oxidase-like deaminating enzyme
MTASHERLRVVTPSASSFDPRATDEPPSRAQVVVIGGGIVGAAVALHLAELGRTDTVVLERASVACGTSWHAAGLVTRTRGTHAQTELASYSRDFYAGLAARSGVDVGYYENGSLSVAQTPERMIELDYALAMARHHGLPARRLAPREIAERWPLIDSGGLVGGALFAGDATVNPGLAAYATAKAAAAAGVRVVEGCRVTGFRLSGARVTGVETDRGLVECEVAVIAAGLWSRELALPAGARLALHAAEHMWLQTEAVEGASRDLPTLRDLDGHIYGRHYRGGLVVGAFEPNGKPRPEASIPPDFAFGEFEPDRRHFAPSLAKARQRVPALQGARIAHYLNAPESFTPDGAFLLGETAEVGGLFVAAGMNSQGIILGPGVGRALAAWIDTGAPAFDAAAVDVRRFAAAQTNAGYLFERTRETLGRLYAMHWPFLQPETAQGLRRVPLYDRLAAAGACFGESAGWERANWFAPPGAEPVYRYSYGRQNWFAPVADEHRAARESVALFDLSSFAKFRVQGPAALDWLQLLCTADLDRAPGAVVYTCLLNGSGGIELDATVTRLGADSFLVVAPTDTQTKTFHWLTRHCDPASVVTDVTSGLGVLAVMGPRSRELLGQLTDARLDDAAFPFATAQEIDVGWTTVLAVRVSFVGELGWELYVPVESLVGLYDRVVAAGKGFGLRHAGYHALDGLRAEKGYRHWGSDMGPADTPFEAGLGFTVALDKTGGFIGRKALRARSAEPLTRRLVHVRLDDPEPLLYGGESLLCEDAVVGRVTSGAYGHTLGAAVGLAFVEAPSGGGELGAGEMGESESGEREFGEREVRAIVASRAVTVDIAGTLVPATLSERPFYDPDGGRLRGTPPPSPPETLAGGD